MVREPCKMRLGLVGVRNLAIDRTVDAPHARCTSSGSDDEQFDRPADHDHDHEQPRTLTMAFTGDTLVHSPLWRQAQRNAPEAGQEGHDFGPMLANLAPVIAPVDLAVCHLETPIAPLGQDFTTFPLYGVPVGIVDAVAAAGYDRCSTASNHTLDRGLEGIDRTVDALEASGLGQSGMARQPDEILPDVFDVRGANVAHLAYTYGFNGLSLPDDADWRSALLDPERIISDAAVARASGADM
jgi:hypothetical protein